MIQFLLNANLIISYIVGVLVIIAVICLVVYCYTYKAMNISSDREDARMKERIASHLNEMERWCSYEYPVIEEVCKHLRSIVDDKPHSRISDFREMLRRKYPKENTGDVQTVIALARGVLDGAGDETWKARMKILSDDLAKKFDVKL